MRFEVIARFISIILSFTAVITFVSAVFLNIINIIKEHFTKKVLLKRETIQLLYQVGITMSILSLVFSVIYSTHKMF